MSAGDTDRPGTEARPLRVAIFGAGPTGFYAAEALLRAPDLVVEVDLFDRLPVPFGLVRFGVAPDHQKIKSVTAAFDRIATHPRFRFFGHVELGKHLDIADLRAHYHQVLFATGAQTDRRMGIPGEDLVRSHPATEFVAWYNGHPDYRDYQFDLTQERVAVVGVGNVAVDVVRILCRTPAELEKTDIAEHALEALRASRVREVYLLGRRGPAQAAFTNPEVKELGEMADADAIVRAEEVELDEVSRAAIERTKDRNTAKKVEILQEYARRGPAGKSRRLHLRFLVSPVEITGNTAGEVSGMRIVRNRLSATDTGAIQAKATGEFEQLEVGLVFRSVGYRGVALPGVPFRDDWGVILNDRGRVLEPDSRQPIVGQYTAGWIKRGPSGVIGTNKPDAVETVQNMLEDLGSGQYVHAEHASAVAAERLIRERQPRCFSYADWQRLDAWELSSGQAVGRPRVKLTRIDDMLAVLARRS